MRIWEIVPAAAEHIPAIAANMREADRREVWASDRWTPEEALWKSLEASSLAWACIVYDVPSFMWGVSRKGSILSDTGVPWLLGTGAIYDVGREFLRQSRSYVDRMQAGYSRLENIVHAENALSLRWLRWCGFTVEKDSIERNGEKFFPFWRESICAR
ncbi:hypothetical protein LJC46_04205 [Desulfovibrio sp. OttesenSCG-928-G15]|nr:hypothetical protein [Desulfovibrio sp. OttesenSCG-928-G15]